MSSTTNRITGLATGLDVDSIVKASMKPYKMKIDSEKQKQSVLEIKQKLYRDVISSGRDFFNKYLNVAKSDSILRSSNYTSVGFDSTDATVATATASSTAVKDNYKVTVTQLATAAKGSYNVSDFTGMIAGNVVIDYNNQSSVVIPSTKFTAGMSDKEIASVINTEISKVGLKASVSDFDPGKIIIESTATGAQIGSNVNQFKISAGGVSLADSSIGKNLHATVQSSKGTVTYDDTNLVSGSNSVTLDGVQFKINSEGTTTINGKTNVSGIKDTIIKFVNDYNAYVEKLNKLVMTPHDRSYQPLTEDQKKEMSADDIKLWNEKVETGQLNRDSDISRIVDNMRSAMYSSVQGSGIRLEDIGITLLKDNVTTKKGTMVVDEVKLTEALEQNPDKIKSLFLQSPSSSAITDEEKFSQTGIASRMKSIFDKEFMLPTSSALIQKAGTDDSFGSYTIPKNIADYKTKISKMEKDLTSKEQAFYNKYAKLESLMNNLNSQQSYLASQLGTSSS